MKSAEQWMKEHGCFGLESVKLAKQIQLDAFKAGMKFAATMLLGHPTDHRMCQSSRDVLITGKIQDKSNSITSIPKECYESYAKNG